MLDHIYFFQMSQFVTTLPSDAVRLTTWDNTELFYEYWVSPQQQKVYKHEGTSYRVLKINNGELSLRFQPNNSQRQHIKLRDVIDFVRTPVIAPPTNEEEEEIEEESELEDEQEIVNNWEYVWLHGKKYLITYIIKIEEVRD